MNLHLFPTPTTHWVGPLKNTRVCVCGGVWGWVGRRAGGWAGGPARMIYFQRLVSPLRASARAWLCDCHVGVNTVIHQCCPPGITPLTALSSSISGAPRLFLTYKLQAGL